MKKHVLFSMGLCLLFSFGAIAQNKTYFVEQFDNMNSNAGGSGVTTETKFWSLNLYPDPIVPADDQCWIFKYSGTSTSADDICGSATRALRIRKTEVGYIITPKLSYGVDKITYTDKRAKKLKIYTSTDNGQTWSSAIAQTNAASCGVNTISINSASVNRIKIENEGAAGDVGINALTITSLSEILPLNFISFTAKPDALGKSVNLNWQTTNEVNTQDFVVERRSNNTEFTSIGTINSKNTAGMHNYSFVDAKPLTGNSYYRLTQRDRDGKSSQSEVSTVTINSVGLSLYPNPVSTQLVVNHEYAKKSTPITIIGLDGKAYIKTSTFVGSSSTTINVGKLATGTYLLRFGNDKNLSQKFIKK